MVNFSPEIGQIRTYLQSTKNKNTSNQNYTSNENIFHNRSGIKSLSNKQKLRDFVIRKPILPKPNNVKESTQAE